MNVWNKWPENKPDPKKIKNKVSMSILGTFGNDSYQYEATVEYKHLKDNSYTNLLAWQYIDLYIPEKEKDK